MTRWAAGFFAFGAFAGLVAVGLEAYAAHGLVGSVPDLPRAEHLFGQGTSFQLAHALALLAVALGVDRVAGRSRTGFCAGGVLIGVGLVVFPGALYVAALRGGHAVLAPFGGTAAMLGWLSLGIGGLLAFRRAG
jgi:uncharacterized membrane protein YgdD (TMEM256/DUF423 family)